MNYAWGSRHVLADLQRRTASDEPEAELWMGAHPKAPSCLVTPSVRVPLDLAIAENPDGLLGSECARRHDQQLPFLFKVLAAEQPLSLQTHPDRHQAHLGFRAEESAGLDRAAPNRTYRDENHKPELVCALSRFEALCGFRPQSDVLRLFDQLQVSSPTLVTALSRLRSDASERAFRGLLRQVMQDPEFRDQVLPQVLDACLKRGSETAFPDSCRWALRLAQRYPRDVGVLTSLLLNYVPLEPGQALFLSAGTLHSYLGGTALEVMANSDNVLRGGLTSKHVDVKGLLDTLRFERGIISPIDPVQVGNGVLRYVTPAAEFELWRIELGQDGLELPASGPQILFVAHGRARLKGSGSFDTLQLDSGQSAFVAPSADPPRLSGSGVAFRAGLPPAS